jgi:hypothetical protein
MESILKRGRNHNGISIRELMADCKKTLSILKSTLSPSQSGNELASAKGYTWEKTNIKFTLNQPIYKFEILKP